MTEEQQEDARANGSWYKRDRTKSEYGFNNNLSEKEEQTYNKFQRRRLVNKSGDCNIIITHASEKKRKYFVDIFTTMLDLKWRYNLLVFGSVFIGSWFVFACIWYIILVARQDHLHKDDPEWTMCMSNVHDFQTALLFSIETQHTIGYGFRSMEPKCAEAFIILMLQSVLGVFMQSLVTGIIFAKISRPKARSRTVLFSENAVICKRDNESCLLFRIGDMRKSHIVGTSIRAIMVKNRLTKEGEIIPMCQVPLRVETETALPDDNCIFLAWPVTILHRINSESPFWKMSAAQLVDQKFELVVILDGTIETSGYSIQLRTSYLPTEILWGHHLAPLVAYQKEDGQYCVDFTLFHNTIPVEMEECSASCSGTQEQKPQNQRRLSRTGSEFSFTPLNTFDIKAAKKKQKKIRHKLRHNSIPNSRATDDTRGIRRGTFIPMTLMSALKPVQSFPHQMEKQDTELMDYLTDMKKGGEMPKMEEREADDLLLTDSEEAQSEVSDEGHITFGARRSER